MFCQMDTLESFLAVCLIRTNNAKVKDYIDDLDMPDELALCALLLRIRHRS